MAREEFRKCPRCGEPVPVGDTRCPKGHECVWSFPEADSKDGDSSELGLSSPNSQEVRFQDALFECYRCQRLLDIQSYQGRMIVPRFCPWCGKPISSLIGRELDGYRIDEILSAGGFGIIYLASNITQPAMKSVVKILRPRIAYSRPDFIKLFTEEARLTEAIGQTCWNIVRVSNVRERPWPYFFMEYIRGITLDQFIAENRVERLPIADCLGCLRGIARGLAATHARGRVHRDLKPLNIMVIKSKGIARFEERIKMLDFGLAMKIGKPVSQLDFTDFSGERSTDFTDTDDSPVVDAGTPEYMSPEAFDGINDFEADIYAFGVTAYEVLTGQRPWKEPAAGSDRLKYWSNCHKYKRPVSIRELRSAVPKRLAKTVADCLEKDPVKRIPSAEELYKRLAEPASGWLWLLLPAAVLLLTFAAWGFLRDDEVKSVTRWMSAGESLYENTLYVRDAEALSTREVHAVVTDVDDAGSFQWTSNPDSVLVRPDADHPDRLIIEFPDAEGSQELLDGKLAIRGVSKSFLRSVVTTGELRIVQDADPPQIAEGYHFVIPDSEPPEPLREVTKELRFRRKLVRFLVEIKEPSLHPGKVVFLVPPKGEPGRQQIQAGQRESFYGEDSWSFPPPDLPDGTYRGQVKAEDRAGNIALSEPLEFTLDDSVGLDVETILLADGRACLPFTFRGDLAKITVSFKGSGNLLEAEYYPAAGISGPLALARRLREGQKPVPFGELEHRKSYFLAVPVTPERDPLELELRARDSAIPRPNETDPPRICRRALPAELALDRDVTGFSMLIEGQKTSIDPRYFYMGQTGIPRPVKCEPAERATEGSLTAELTIGLDSSRILAVQCHTEKAWNASVHTGRAVFEKLQLKADEPNQLRLTFQDPLKRESHGTLVVLPDTREPHVEVVLSSGGDRNPPYHEVSSGADVTLTVRSPDEPLSRVQITRTEKRVLLKADTLKGQSEFSTTLEDFDVKEGDNLLLIEAEDLAGHVERRSENVILNPSGPEVSPLDDFSNLGERDDARLNVEDRNGIDFDGTEFAFELAGTGARIPVPVSKAKGQAPVEAQIRLDLEKLPDDCEGELSYRVADVLGRVTKERIPFKFRRRGWNDRVEWKDLTWLLFTSNDRDYYISTTEITNQDFRNPRFIDTRGAYLDRTLRKKYSSGPRFWNGNKFPQYVRAGKPIPADDYPVVGISPEESEAFAREIYSARLPLRHEWLSAARMGSRDSEARFPWKDDEPGKQWVNYRFTSEEKPPEIARTRTEFMLWQEKRIPCRLVKARARAPSLDEFILRLGVATVLKERRSLLVYHQLGNVRELVRDPQGTSGYAIVGGSFMNLYDQIGLDKDPVAYSEPDHMTGFRLVIDLETAHPEFKRKAKK